MLVWILISIPHLAISVFRTHTLLSADNFQFCNPTVHEHCCAAKWHVTNRTAELVIQKTTPTRVLKKIRTLTLESDILLAPVSISKIFISVMNIHLSSQNVDLQIIAHSDNDSNSRYQCRPVFSWRQGLTECACTILVITTHKKISSNSTYCVFLFQFALFYFITYFLFRYEVYVAARNGFGISRGSVRAVFTTPPVAEPIRKATEQVPAYNESSCCVSAGIKRGCLDLCNYNVNSLFISKYFSLRKLTKDQKLKRNHIRYSWK